MQIRSRLSFAIAGALLAGCAAKNPVVKQEHWGTQGPRGPIFSLPQMRVDARVQLNRSTYTAGEFTKDVDACSSDNVPTDLAAICNRLRLAGVDRSLRFSDPSAAQPVCTGDGGNSEVRIAIAEDVTLEPTMVPDPTEVYAVPLNRGYFQNFALSLELNANGTVGKGSLTTTNLGASELVAFAAQFAGRQLTPRSPAPAASGSAAVAGAPITIQALKGEDARPPEISRLEAALRELEQLQSAARNLAIAQSDQPLASRAAILAHLLARIELAKEPFLGTVSVQPLRTVDATWIVGRKPTTLAEFDLCGRTDPSRPRWLMLVPDPMDDLEAPLASGDAVPDVKPLRGWPYRVPREATVSLAVCTARTSEPVAPLFAVSVDQGTVRTCKPIAAIRGMVPQFGKTFHLPERTGARTSAIAPEYRVDGSLKSLTVSQEGESPAPFITAAQSVLLPPEPPARPSESTQLGAEADTIEARQRLCRLVLSVPEGDPRCMGPNPPTSAPQQ